MAPTRSDLPSVTPDQLRILTLMYAWRFDGRMTCDGDGNDAGVERLEYVPALLLRAELRESGIAVDAQFEILERKNLVQRLQQWWHASGCWRLPDGRRLGVRLEFKPEPPGSPIVVFPPHSVHHVRLDGVEVGSDEENECFDLTGKGIDLVERARTQMGGHSQNERAPDAQPTTGIDDGPGEDTRPIGAEWSVEMTKTELIRRAFQTDSPRADTDKARRWLKRHQWTPSGEGSYTGRVRLDLMNQSDRERLAKPHVSPREHR